MTEKQLNKLDKTLCFYQPQQNTRYKSDEIYFKISRYRRKEHEQPDKSDYSKMTFSRGLVELLEKRYSNNLTTEKSLRSKREIKKAPIAFSFGGGAENYAILNPTANVPHLIGIIRANGASEINNSVLVDDIYNLYKLDKTKIFSFRLDITFFATVSKLDLYRIELKDDRGRELKTL